MARSRTHTLTPRHLAVLQWMDRFSVTKDRPDGWCSEARIQKNIRIDGERLAIGEALHDLTVKLNEKDDPFIITHPSGRHYRISAVGRAMAKKCTVATVQTEMGLMPTVVVAATGKKPIIRSYDYIPPVNNDDDEDLNDEVAPTEPAERPQPAARPATQRAMDTTDADEVYDDEAGDTPTEEVDTGIAPDDDTTPTVEPGYDEINDAPRPDVAARRSKPNPAKKPMPAIGKPAAPKAAKK